MMQCQYCDGRGARSYGESCTMCRGTGEREPLKIQLPPVLMDADVEQLEQALYEARCKQQADRIRRLGELKAEYGTVMKRRAELRSEISKLEFTLEDCPRRHMHKADVTCSMCGCNASTG